MQHFITSINNWLLQHKSTTLPAWIKRNPEIQKWIVDSTAEFSPKNIMESVYIILNGPPDRCKFGNFKQFNTFELGYRKGCVLGNKCKCVGEYRLTQQRETLKHKYGVETSGQIPGVLDKRKTTMISRYGVEFAAQSKEIQHKRSLTVLSHTDEFKQSIQNKLKKTSTDKYGVEHHMKLSSQKCKVRTTNLEKYGVEFPLQNSDIKTSARQKYLSKSTSEIELIRKSTQNTLLRKYGVTAASRIHLSQTTLEILDNEEKFRNYVNGLTRKEATDSLDISDYTLYLYSIKYNASDLFARPAMSAFELEVGKFIEELGLTIDRNNRTIIPPKELDIYIPEKNIAIECCGLYWHAEKSAGRLRDYHVDKFTECNEKNILLITIFEDEWTAQQQQVKSRLQHIVGASFNKIYARNCIVKETTSKNIKAFVDQYHLQGHISSSINLTLEHNGIVVAAMTFGKARYNKQHQYELLRFCTCNSVIGAAGKLFSYFLKKYAPHSVVSYSDNRWGVGNVYKSLGFVKEADTVGYFYTDYRQRYNRVQYQKHKLVATGHDSNLSEWEIMQQQGFDRIWDCGQSRWLYTAA